MQTLRETGVFDRDEYGTWSALRSIEVRIVVVSPFVAERLALEALLRADGHDVVSLSDRSSAAMANAMLRPDLIVADAQVPGLDGLALVRELAARGAPRVILLCPRVSRVLEKHGVRCLRKPVDLAELLRHVNDPIQRAQLA